MQFSDTSKKYCKSILVESGLKFNEIVKRALQQGCGNTLQNTRACLITHYHGDHAVGMKDLIANGRRVYASEEVFNHYKVSANIKNILRDEVPTIIEDRIQVFPFRVEHDAEDSQAFIIWCEVTNELVLFVNDCKYFTQDLSAFTGSHAFDYIFIECNYEDKMTRTIYNNAVKENDLQKIKQYKRVIDAHMGLNTTKKILSKLDLSKCKAIFLMHLSDRNANEYRMKLEVKDVVGKTNVLVCQKLGGVK